MCACAVLASASLQDTWQKVDLALQSIKALELFPQEEGSEDLSSLRSTVKKVDSQIN